MDRQLPPAPPPSRRPGATARSSDEEPGWASAAHRPKDVCLVLGDENRPGHEICF